MSLSTYTSLRHTVELMVNSTSDDEKYLYLVKLWSISRAYDDVSKFNGLTLKTVKQFEKINELISSYYRGYEKGKEYLRSQARYVLDRIRPMMMQEIYDTMNRLQLIVEESGDYNLNYGLSVRKRGGCFSFKMRDYSFI